MAPVRLEFMSFHELGAVVSVDFSIMIFDLPCSYIPSSLSLTGFLKLSLSDIRVSQEVIVLLVTVPFEVTRIVMSLSVVPNARVS